MPSPSPCGGPSGATARFRISHSPSADLAKREEAGHAPLGERHQAAAGEVALGLPCGCLGRGSLDSGDLPEVVPCRRAHRRRDTQQLRPQRSLSGAQLLPVEMPLGVEARGAGDALPKSCIGDQLTQAIGEVSGDRPQPRRWLRARGPARRSPNWSRARRAPWPWLPAPSRSCRPRRASARERGWPARRAAARRGRTPATGCGHPARERANRRRRARRPGGPGLPPRSASCPGTHRARAARPSR